MSQPMTKDPMILIRSTIHGKTKDGSADRTVQFINREETEKLYSALQDALNSSPTAEVNLVFNSKERERNDGSGSFLSTVLFVQSAEPRDQSAPKTKYGFKPRAVAAPSSPKPAPVTAKKF